MKSSVPSDARGSQSALSLWPAALLVVVASVIVHAVLVRFTAPALLTGELIDTDSYMRLVRVRELASEGRWFDSVIDRNNWPYGDELHWTRPFDVLILLGTWALTPFLGFTTALYWAGALVSPLLQIATSIALAWAVLPLVSRRLAPLVMIAVLAQPGFMGYALAGRPDHHTFLLLIAVLVLGAFARAASTETLRADAVRWAFCTGCLAAFGLWGSTELLVPLAIVLATSGVAYVVANEPWLAVNRGITRGLFLGVGVALVFERPLVGIGSVEFDRISVVHLTLVAALWAVWWSIERRSSRDAGPRSWRGRLTVAGLGGAFVAGTMALAFPTFFRGPMADMDPRLFAIWYDRITELEPMWPADLWEFGRLVAYLGGALLGPLAAIVFLVTRPKQRWAWTVWAASAGTYALMATTYNIRFAGGAELFAIPLVIVWLGPVFKRIESLVRPLAQIPLRSAATAAVLVGPIFLGGFIMGLDQESEPEVAGMESCDVKGLSEWMTGPEGPGPEPRTVLTFIDFGPELLYRTPHRVLAGPYHRNASGILGIHDAFTTPDVQVRRSLLAEREVGWILICPARDEGVFHTPGSLYSSLMEEGERPFPEVPLPVALADEFRLFSVDGPRLSQGQLQSDSSIWTAVRVTRGAGTSR